MGYFWTCPKCRRLDTFGDDEPAECLREDCDKRAEGLAAAEQDLLEERFDNPRDADLSF